MSDQRGGDPRRVWRTVGTTLAAALPVGFVVLFFWYPVVSILQRGLGESPSAIWDVLSGGGTGGVIWFTIWQAVLSTLLTMLVGLPVAWALARFRVPGKGIIRALLTVPFVLPTVVVAAALTSTFDAFGLDDADGLQLRHTTAAILIAHVFFNVAVVVRTVGAFWAGLDRRPEEAARMLGASRWRAFREVTLRQLTPSLSAAGAIVFLFSFTSFGVVLILGGPTKATIETEIFRFAARRIDYTTASVLALVQLVAVVLLLALTEMLRQRAAVGTGSTGADQAVRPQGRAEVAGVTAALTGGLVLVTVPLLVLVERSLSTGSGYSFDNFRALNTTGRFSALVVPASEAVTNSLWYAVLATAIAVGVGVPAALVVVHGRAGVSRVIDIAFTVPVGTSAVTLGFGILIALDSPPFDFRSSWFIVPITQGLIGIPFVMRAVVPTLRSIDQQVRDAAAVLGAPPSRIRREIDLPIGLRGVTVGASFAFAMSLGEFGATSFLARPAKPTVPVAIFELLGRPGETSYGQAMALSVILVLLTAAAVLVIERVQPRSGVFG